MYNNIYMVIAKYPLQYIFSKNRFLTWNLFPCLKLQSRGRAKPRSLHSDLNHPFFRLGCQGHPITRSYLLPIYDPVLLLLLQSRCKGKVDPIVIARLRRKKVGRMSSYMLQCIPSLHFLCQITVCTRSRKYARFSSI